MPGAHQSHSVTPLLSWTGERKYNKRLMGPDKDREITQQLPWQANQTRLREINLIYCKSNQSRTMRNKKINLKTPSLHPFLLLGLNFTHDFSPSSPQVVQGDGEWGLQSVHHTLSLPLLPPQGEDSSHSAPAQAWGPSHGTQSSMNCSSKSTFHKLQFFMNCSRVGPPWGHKPCQ